MAHDVFISYSSRDKAVADAACAALESRKIRCWIAPRDVPPGQPWAGELVRAIDDSPVFVLVLSSESNRSIQVLREVERAVDREIPIIPLRVENVEPSGDMEFFIKTLHWLDALTPPLEAHLQRLCDSVQALLTAERQRTEPIRLAGVAAAERAAWPGGGPPTVAARVKSRRDWLRWTFAAIVLAVLVLCSLSAWLLAGRPLLAKLNSSATAGPNLRVVAVETSIQGATPAVMATPVNRPAGSAGAPPPATPISTATRTPTASPALTRTPAASPILTETLTSVLSPTVEPATPEIEIAVPMPVTTVVLGPIDQIPADWVEYKDPGGKFTLRHPSDWEAIVQEQDSGSAMFRFGILETAAISPAGGGLTPRLGDEKALRSFYQVYAGLLKKQGKQMRLAGWGWWSSPMPASFLELIVNEETYMLAVGASVDANHSAVALMERSVAFEPHGQEDMETLARVFSSMRFE